MNIKKSESVNGCHFERRGEYESGLPRYVVVNTRSPEAETERKAIRTRAQAIVDYRQSIGSTSPDMTDAVDMLREVAVKCDIKVSIPKKPSCFVAYRHPLKHEVVAELEAIRQRIVSGKPLASDQETFYRLGRVSGARV